LLAGGRSRTDLVGGPRIGFGPGITSGLGCVLAPVRHDFVQSIGQPLADAATAHIDGSFADQAAAGRRLLEEDGVPLAEIVVRHEADLLFRGQSHVFRVPVTAPGFDPWPTTTPLTSFGTCSSLGRTQRFIAGTYRHQLASKAPRCWEAGGRSASAFARTAA
jgi:hypothetical protein